MQDTQKLFNAGTANAKNRSIKFSSIDDVDAHAQQLILYIREAAANNPTQKQPAEPLKHQPISKKP